MIYKWSVRIALLNKTYWSQAKDETFNPPLVNRADMYFSEKRVCVCVQFSAHCFSLYCCKTNSRLAFCLFTLTFCIRFYVTYSQFYRKVVTTFIYFIYYVIYLEQKKCAYYFHALCHHKKVIVTFVWGQKANIILCMSTLCRLNKPPKYRSNEKEAAQPEKSELLGASKH